MKHWGIYFLIFFIFIGCHTQKNRVQDIEYNNLYEIKIFLIDVDYNFRYYIERISYENILEDIKKYLSIHNTGILINNIFFENSLLIIDLDSKMPNRLDAGSTGGYILFNMILYTFASLPNVNQMKILIDCEPDRFGHHFDLTGIFYAENFRNH